MTWVIQVHNLTKTFKSGSAVVKAVDGVDLHIKKGEIFGFLGPNGAGKTTTMRMLTTLLKPTSGQAMIAGFDLMTQEQKVRCHIGYVSQTGGLERSATARENLILQGRVYGMSATQAADRAQELIGILRLESFADRLVETYSGGQRRRVDIALGMMHKPQVLFLDEPTIALDPQSRAMVWQEIKKLRAQGTTIFLSTHYLDEADILCDRVAIIDQGTIVALDTPTALKKQIASDVIVVGLSAQLVDLLNTTQLFSEFSDIREIIKEKEALRFLVNNGEALLPRILRILDNAKIDLTTISLHRPTLDDVFLQKTGRTFKQ